MPASSNPMGIRRAAPTVILAACAIGAAVGVWHLWNFAPDTRPILQPASAVAAPAVGVDEAGLLAPAPRSLGDYSNTVRRPLFFADRRPPDRTPVKAAETAIKPPPTPPSPLEQFQLLGIERRRGALPRALIRTTAGGQGVWFEVGDFVRGWKVSEITDQNAVFLANGFRGELRLFALRTGKAR